MSDSIFGDLDIANAADDPFKIDDGTYRGTVTDAKVQDHEKDGVTKKYLIIDFTVTDPESPMYERKISEWKEIPQPKNPKAPTADEARAASFLKMRLTSLGIPPERMNKLNTDDLKGIDVVFVVKTKGAFTNLNKVELAKSAAVGGAKGGFK